MTTEARERIAHYIEMRRQKPIMDIGDTIHTAHTGTEWAAELLLSDLAALTAAAKPEK